MACKLVYVSQRHFLHAKFVYSIDLKAYFSNKNDKSSKTPDTTEVTKESLQWRSSWDEKKDQWYSKLKMFAPEKTNMDLLKLLHTPIDLRLSSIQKWYKRKQEDGEIFMQQYLPDRNKVLGNNLAAAHFIVYRGGSVKFYDEPVWIVLDENTQFNLPDQYVASKVVQALDCSNVKLYYEGLENFRGLKDLQWLSLRNCSEINDWCIDRICGMFMDSLLYLDIRNCNKITYRGVGALYKVRKLETLLIDDVTKNKHLELTCLMLQELLPKLEIKSHD